MARTDERTQGLLLAAEICRRQYDTATPEECACAIEEHAETLRAQAHLTTRYDNQTVMHDEWSW